MTRKGKKACQKVNYGHGKRFFRIFFRHFVRTIIINHNNWLVVPAPPNFSILGNCRRIWSDEEMPPKNGKKETRKYLWRNWCCEKLRAKIMTPVTSHGIFFGKLKICETHNKHAMAWTTFCRKTGDAVLRFFAMLIKSGMMD